MGIYEISLELIAFDTGIDKDMVIKILERFKEDEKIKYENGWIALKNFTKYQKDNPKVNRGIEILLKQVPNNLIQWANIDYDRLSIDYRSLSHLNNNNNPNPNPNHNTNIKEKMLCVSPVETVDTVDKSIELKKEMLDLVSGCFKEDFLNKLFKQYPAEKIEKYFEELKYKEGVINPVGWLVAALKNDYQEIKEEGG